MLEKLLAKRHLHNLELGSVRAKLQEKLGWNADQAQRVEGDYKRFLYALAHKRPEDILSPPTQEVDEFWHQHILDTRKYRNDCQTIFGHYVDHTPGLEADKQRQADRRRQEVYQEFDIDTISFDSCDSSDLRGTHRDGGNVLGVGGHTHGHGSHGHHAGSGHGDGGGAHGGDSGGHGGDAGGGDAGSGGDSGSGCGGSSCGGGSCGGS